MSMSMEPSSMSISMESPSMSMSMEPSSMSMESPSMSISMDSMTMPASGGSTIGMRPSKKSCSKPVAMPSMATVTSRPIMNSWSRSPLFFSRNSTVCPALTSMTSEPNPYSVMLTRMCASGSPPAPDAWPPSPPDPQAAASMDTVRIIAAVDRTTAWTSTLRV